MDILNNITRDNDDDESYKINIDELYEKKQSRDINTLNTYNKILARIHNKIKYTSRQTVTEKFCWFVIPEVVLGVPKFDHTSCTAYIIHQLRDNGGSTTFEIAPSGSCSGVPLSLAQDVTVNGGAGALTAGANSDIRLVNGSWTGDYSCKLQHHDNYFYIQGGSNGHIFRRSGGANAWIIDSSGHFRPGSNNTYDVGTTSNRVRNIYTNDLNLSNEGSKNDVDGTWGDYTMQEGESDLFLINNRSGKKYKFNLTEVS